MEMIRHRHAAVSPQRPFHAGGNWRRRRTCTRPLLALLPLAALGLLPGRAAAQEPGIFLEIASRALEVGEAVDAQLVCTNIGRPTAPQYVQPDGLEVAVLSSTPNASSMTSIVNGRATHRTTYTYALRVTGKKPGAYTIGPITVEADGQTYSTQPTVVQVREAARSAEPDGDKLVFVKLAVEPQTLYVTQTFKATLTIGIRKVYLKNQLVDYDDLLRTVDARASNLSVFGPRFNGSAMSIADSSGQRHEYLVFRDTKEIRGEEVGRSEIGPIFVKVNYPTAFRRSFWSIGLEPSQTSPVIARADALACEVKAPPQEGRPADFTGAIGQFAISADAKPDRVQQGQPVTLTITLQGSPIDGVAGPGLRTQPELASRFEFTEDEFVGDVERPGVKVFRRAVFPKQAGQQTIPPISWSYFDPQVEKYVSLRTEPIPITVDAAVAGAQEFASSAGQPDNRTSALTLVRGGLSPNYVDPELLLANQTFEFGKGPLLATVVAPPMIWFLALLSARRRAKYRGDAGLARRRRAVRASTRLVSRALNEETAQSQLSGLAQAMTLYLSHRFDLPPGALTPSEAGELIRVRADDPATADQVAGFLAQCDAVRFAPSDGSGVSPREAAIKVRRWIQKIERNGK